MYWKKYKYFCKVVGEKNVIEVFMLVYEYFMIFVGSL